MLGSRHLAGLVSVTAAMTMVGTGAVRAGAMAAEADAAGVTSRGPERGDRERGNRDRGQPPAGGEQRQAEQKKQQCPEDAWSLPVQVKGVACVLLLPKPEDGTPAASSAP